MDICIYTLFAYNHFDIKFAKILLICLTKQLYFIFSCIVLSGDESKCILLKSTTTEYGNIILGNSVVTIYN